MTDLATLAARASDIVGWTLIHFLWQGTALALALAFVQLLLPRGMARARYAAGCVTLALMLVVPASTAWWLADPSEPASPFFDDAPVAALSTASATPAAVPVAASPAGPGNTTRRVVVDPDGWLPWLVLAWSLGVLGCSIRLAGGWWHARQLVTRGTRPLSADWQDVKNRLALRLGLTRAVTLLESTRLQVPVVVGWLRPVLLVPTAVLGGLSPQQLEAVIAHELAHIRRHDYLVNLLQSAVETLLFYHPASLVGVAVGSRRTRALLRRPGGRGLRRRRALRARADRDRDHAIRRDGCGHGCDGFAIALSRATPSGREAAGQDRLVGLGRRAGDGDDGVRCGHHELDARGAGGTGRT